MLFDYDKDGRITTQDLGPVIRAVGLKPTESELKAIKRIVDENHGNNFFFCNFSFTSNTDKI